MSERRTDEIRRIQSEIIGRRYAGASLASISFGNDESRLIFEWLKSGRNFLVLIGPPGVGKTYFCSALLEWVIGKFSTFRYWHEREFFTRLRGVVSSSGEYSKEVEYMLDHEFVMYDDFGSCGTNHVGKFREENLLAMIDIRYESTKPTVITTNMNKKSIFDVYGSRASSRMFDKTNLVIDMSGMKDMRKL